MDTQYFELVCHKVAYCIWFLERLHPTDDMHIVNLDGADLEQIYNGTDKIQHWTRPKPSTISFNEEQIPIVYQSKEQMSPSNVMVFISKSHVFFRHERDYERCLVSFCLTLLRRESIHLSDACVCCGKITNLIDCIGCHVVKYCSLSCFRSYSKSHKDICHDIAHTRRYLTRNY